MNVDIIFNESASTDPRSTMGIGTMARSSSTPRPTRGLSARLSRKRRLRTRRRSLCDTNASTYCALYFDTNEIKTHEPTRRQMLHKWKKSRFATSSGESKYDTTRPSLESDYQKYIRESCDFAAAQPEKALPRYVLLYSGPHLHAGSCCSFLSTCTTLTSHGSRPE